MVPGRCGLRTYTSDRRPVVGGCGLASGASSTLAHLVKALDHGSLSVLGRPGELLIWADLADADVTLTSYLDLARPSSAA